MALQTDHIKQKQKQNTVQGKTASVKSELIVTLTLRTKLNKIWMIVCT